MKVYFERRKIAKAFITHVQDFFRKSLSKATFERKLSSVSLPTDKCSWMKNKQCQNYFCDAFRSGICIQNIFLVWLRLRFLVSTHFVRHKLDTGTRGHSLKLFAHHSRIDAHKHFFCNRTVQSWYSLPATPTDFSSLTCFRRYLGRIDLSRFRIGKD